MSSTRNLSLRKYRSNIDTIGIKKKYVHYLLAFYPNSRPPYPLIKGHVLSKLQMCHVMSCLIISPHYFFGLPLSLLRPTMVNLSHLFTGVSRHLLFICPNHLNFTSRILSTTGPTPTLSRISSCYVSFFYSLTTRYYMSRKMKKNS